MRRSKSNLWAVALAAAMLATLLPFGGGVAQAQVDAILCNTNTSVAGHFNADEYADLAVGAPGDDLSQDEIDLEPVGENEAVVSANSGSVSIAYGSERGSDGGGGAEPQNGTGLKYVSQDTPGVQSDARGGDSFGASLAVGDFNGDGFDDLAVGSPGKGNGAGGVHIFYSDGVNGLQVGTPGSNTYNQFISVNDPGLVGNSTPGDLFGWALESADFNGDGQDDLAIGAPGTKRGKHKDAGLVYVIYGAPVVGLTPNGPAKGGVLDSIRFGQPKKVIGEDRDIVREAGDFHGAALSAGDYDGDGRIDLAIGAPGEDVRSRADAGAVMIVHSGGKSGLVFKAGPSRATPEGEKNRRRFFHQNTVHPKKGTGPWLGFSEPGDRFGCSLAGGDYDGDGDTDLAIGVPGESIGSVGGAGLVQVGYNAGPRGGITATPYEFLLRRCTTGGNCWTFDQHWSENDGGIPGVSKFNDHFGSVLVAADIDQEGTDDLVVGVPDEELYGHQSAGSIRVMQGFQQFGLTDTIDLVNPALAFAQRPQCYVLPAEVPEFIGFPCDADYTPAGMVVEEGDRFGASIAVADFDGNTVDANHTDIAVGVPGEGVGFVANYLTEEVIGLPQDVDELPAELQDITHLDDEEDAGVVQILYANFAPTFNSIFDVDEPPNPDVLYRQQGQPRSGLDPRLDEAGVPNSDGTGIIGGNLNGNINVIGNPGMKASQDSQSGAVAGDSLGGRLPQSG